MMQDLYEILQVHPKADQDTIRDAYERLRERYNPEKLEGAAEELIELTQRKRADIEHAYAILGDSTRRATYDEEQKALQDTQAEAAAAQEFSDDDLIDYSPLPPARGEERPRNFDAQPVLKPRQLQQRERGGRKVNKKQKKKARPMWVVPTVTVAAVTFIIMLTALLLTNGGQMRYAADANASASSNANPAASSNQDTGQGDQQSGAQEHRQIIDDYEAQLVAARQVVDMLSDNPEAWIRLGDALYDSAQVVRELQPESELYTERRERWIEASAAYEKALELGGDDVEKYAVVRSDMGVSLCYYGSDTASPEYVQQGLQHTRQAVQEFDKNGRVLLNQGICLISAEPPQTDEALDLWLKVLNLPSAEQGVVQQAQRLIGQYTQE
jgi:curved DNA-binding protein CbpA